MYIIEPCCAKKHVMQLRDALGKSGTTLFEGYGDMSLTELLPALLTRYSETEMLIAAPSIPNQAADIIRKWMRQKWARMDGKGKLNVIEHLTIIADLGKEKSPTASGWLKKSPFGDRLTLVDKQQAETVILLRDLAIVGPVNMQYGHHFVATMTARPSHVKDLWTQWQKAAEEKAEETPECLDAGSSDSR